MDQNPDLQCSPATWYSVAFFFFTNYFIHAATVKSLPGETSYTSITYKVSCLLVPFAGIRRGLNVFLRASILARTPLHGATRANALCMIVRSKDWRPRSGDIIDGCELAIEEPNASAPRVIEDIEKEMVTIKESRKSINVELNVKAPYNPHAPSTWWGKLAEIMLRSYRFRAMPLEQQVVQRKDIKVHGVCELPPGYVLCFIPPDMDVRPRGASSSETYRVDLASQFNALQVLWSITQTLIGSFTLWKARGSQLEKFGFAAYGLTVIPYIIASIINLLGGLVSRQYNYAYLVHSEIMDEVLERGGVVDGVVGTVCPLPNCDEEKTIGDDEHGRLGGAAFAFSGEVGDEGPLLCRRVDTASTEPEVILTLAPPEELPTAEPDQGKWKSGWLKLIGAMKTVNGVIKIFSYSAKKPKDKTLPQTTLSVPSHGRFQRLPPAYFDGVFKLLAVTLLISSIAAPYITIYLLTKFRIREATGFQAQFTMQWLIVGQMFGFFVSENERHTKRSYSIVVLAFVFLWYGSAAIGGTVVVIMEMFEFGICSTW